MPITLAFEIAKSPANLQVSFSSFLLGRELEYSHPTEQDSSKASRRSGISWGFFASAP